MKRAEIMLELKHPVHRENYVTDLQRNGDVISGVMTKCPLDRSHKCGKSFYFLAFSCKNFPSTTSVPMESTSAVCATYRDDLNFTCNFEYCVPKGVLNGAEKFFNEFGKHVGILSFAKPLDVQVQDLSPIKNIKVRTHYCRY